MSQIAIRPSARAVAARPRLDLLGSRAVQALARGSFFPLVLQVAVLLLFAAALYDGFFGSERDNENLLTWGAFTIFFWPIVFTVTMLFGRAWCAVCPIGSISAMANRFSFGLRWPRAVSNLSISLILFVLVLWIIRPISGFDTVPRETAWFFLGIGTLAAIVGLVFEGRVFCRHICPISAHLSVMSLAAPISLEAAAEPGGGRYGRTLLAARPASLEACRSCPTHACNRGTEDREGCPWGLFPAVMGTLNRSCSFCLKCVKNCPTPGTIRAVVRWPFARLVNVSQVKTGEAFSVLVLMSIFLFHMAWGHGTRTPTLMRDGAPNVFPFLSDANATFVAVEMTGLAVIVGLYAAAAFATSRTLGVRYRAAFNLFALAYLPLFLFRTLGYLIQDVLRSGGEWATFALGQLGFHVYLEPELFSSFSDPLFGGTTYNMYAALMTLPILGGLLVAGYVAYGIARSTVSTNGSALRVAAPHLVLMMTIVLVLYEAPYLIGYKVLGSPGWLYG